MIRAIDNLKVEFAKRSSTVFCPEFTQTLSVPQLLDLVPLYDGWIIGDDPATAAVFQAGRHGQLRAAVKWGAGTDNIDFDGAVLAGYDIANTPGTFGEEVSDVALGYLIGLSRDLFFVDREVRLGKWPKPSGTSLHDKRVGVVGYGHIGKALTRKLQAIGMSVVVYDPFITACLLDYSSWPQRIQELDFIVLTCALTAENRHMLNASAFSKMKRGVQIVNVARGGLVDQAALLEALQNDHVAGAALEVLEDEPPEADAPLLHHPKCIFGSHNSSNTKEAVQRTSVQAIQLLFERLQRS
jgi:D-3-phosphoglycerate dehydrogenase